MSKTNAYIVTEGRENFLCVIGPSGESHRFPMDLVALARVQAESAQAIWSALLYTTTDRGNSHAS